jgi:hypothetical protein
MAPALLLSAFHGASRWYRPSFFLSACSSFLVLLDGSPAKVAMMKRKSLNLKVVPFILIRISLLVLANLHGGGDANHPKVLAEYQEIEEALRFEREQAISSFKALTEPRMLKRVFLGMSIQMWSQLCGMNIMM